MTAEGVRLFQGLTVSLEPDDLSFYRNDGRPWNSTDPYPKLEAACALAGIKPRITVHQLRHTCGSVAVMNGIPMVLTARNFGHKSVANTEKYYAHLDDDYVVRTIRHRMPGLRIVTPFDAEGTPPTGA